MAGIDLNAIDQDVAHCIVVFGGGTAKVEFKPSILTGDFIANLEGVSDDEVFFGALADLLVSWDIRRGNKKVPTTTAGIKSIPLTLTREVVRAILQDAGADPEA